MCIIFLFKLSKQIACLISEIQSMIPQITLYFRIDSAKNRYEVMIMKEKQTKSTVDKNFFKALNYEIAGEVGAIDNEDMLNNRKLISDQTKNPQSENKK